MGHELALVDGREGGAETEENGVVKENEILCKEMQEEAREVGIVNAEDGKIESVIFC